MQWRLQRLYDQRSQLVSCGVACIEGVTYNSLKTYRTISRGVLFEGQGVMMMAPCFVVPKLQGRCI